MHSDALHDKKVGVVTLMVMKKYQEQLKKGNENDSAEGIDVNTLSEKLPVFHMKSKKIF